jgi:phosphoglucomutase
VPSYLSELSACIDRDVFRGARLGVVYDALHGTGSGVCDRALGQLGVRVELLHGERSPRFGGGAPDPVPARLGELTRRVRAGSGLRIGLATDGDADRYAVIDADGRALSETQALALLVDQLARTGRAQRGVAISIATGSLPERVAVEHGLAVVRYPIGFKHLTQALYEGSADLAGEESGGFALGAMARDKDGILACALLAELAAATRAPLRARLTELERRHGRSVCGRLALPASDATRARLARLRAASPERAGAQRVRAVDTRDGLRLGLDDGFLMLRASGTEPVLRIYAEAPDRSALERRFAVGRRLLDASARAR